MTIFLCKTCGAESPPGIGYADTSEGPLPAPAPECPNPHAERKHSHTEITVDGVRLTTDKDQMIGWMEDWSAPFDKGWLDRGLVISIPHNSGGLGGASYQLTDKALDPCAYCNELGHHWTTHPEAVADARAWDRQVHAEEFPFGDHREG